ncbi:MAG: hypothetical protein ACI9QD_000420 [Thermoproteota archaeon]|jgi:hypothetical protein
MLKYIIIFTVIISCTQKTLKKSKYKIPKSCIGKISKKFKIKSTRSNKLNFSISDFKRSLNKSYSTDLYENVIHYHLSYLSEEGTRRTLEFKWNNRDNKFDVITSFIKNDFEFSLDSQVLHYLGLVEKLKQVTPIYKQSFYFIGLKKLNLIFDKGRLVKTYMGKDFSCRFDTIKTDCSCARWFY